MILRYIFIVWTILCLCKVDVVFSGSANHAYLGPYNSVSDENPVSLFEVQGAHEVNKFTSGGLYRATISENAAIGSDVKSPVKMGLYMPENGATIEYVVSGINSQHSTRQIAASCSGTHTFRVGGKRMENFYSLTVQTTRMLSEESCESYLLTVKAKYSGDKKRTIDITKVFIKIQVASNIHPNFNKTSALGIIPFNFPSFQPILQLSTAVKDKHSIGKVYFLLKQRSKYFALNPVNGVLFLKRPLPVALKQHRLVAYVRKWDLKLSGKALNNTCNITIKVKPVNQYSPLISVHIVTDIVENKTLIAIITVSDRDEGKNGEIDSLIISSGDQEGYFGLEKVAKKDNVYHLRLAKPLHSKFYRSSLTFTATDHGYPAKRSSKVHRFKLVDFLSTKIYFPRENYFVNVSEMMPINSTVIQIKALNLKPKSIFTYSIHKGDSLSKFSIKQDTGEITVAGTLDADTASVYVVKVTLNILGDTPAAISANVHIQVEDFNDHAPEFTNDVHNVEIQEDMAIHTSIYQVQAKDGDMGENGQVSYWLTNSDQFSIHPKTGVISVKQLIDRDSGIPEYAYLVVRAGDNGSPFRREAETMVKVKIKAWNDNGPVIKQHDCRITLSHGTQVGTKLIQIQAIDIDVDRKTQPFFMLTLGNTGGYFAVDSSSGYVTVAKPLGNAHNSYTLVISASDGTQKSLNKAFLYVKIDGKKTEKQVSCTNSSVFIRALKVERERQIMKTVVPFIDRKPQQNNYAPQFADRELTITVSEDIAIGSVLTSVKATDNDIGYEGLLTYYIVGGNHNQCFGLDMLTGELKTIAELDREQVAKYELNVSAWDSGISRKADFVKVTVIVEDLNDSPPVFDREIYNISVPENSLAGTTDLKLVAKDDDVGINKQITYQLINDYNKLFSVDNNRGNLIVNMPLDFEKEKFYSINVLAFDGSSTNQHFSEAVVNVNVLDRNDNSPIVNPVIQNIFVMKDLPPSSPITLVAADDQDSGNGGILSFTLAVTHGSELFFIDSITGLLKLKRSLSSSTDRNYNLTIIVSDHGQPPLTSKAYINVNIIQRISDENFKKMNSYGGIMTYDVPENAPAGGVVKLGNDNSNPDTQNSFLFSIIDGTDVTRFNITDSFGLLTTTVSLDREEIPFYWLTIQVVARQSRQFHSNMQLLIKVTDDNDNDPMFYPPVYESNIPENTKANEMLVKVSAFDGDSGNNGKLTYSIINGNNKGHFKIDSNTGLITTTDLPLDYEKQRLYQLLLSVTDSGAIPRTSQASLTILLQDDNDNQPEFKQDLNIDFLISGRSIIPNNTLLGQILATDIDQGDNGVLTFKILSGNEDGKLRIDPKSGQLWSNVNLTTLDAFQLEIEAKDHGHQPLSATTIIDITVNQRSLVRFGKNPPTFSQKQTSIVLKEDTLIGHKIDIIPATDMDHDILKYFIKSGNEDQKFQLDPNGDSLKLIAKLDAATSPVYHIVVGATDGFYFCDFTLNIEVTDMNDHYPIPEMIEKIETVSENVALGTKVVTVSAFDLDSGLNAQIGYSLKSAAVSKSLNLFAIDQQTGDITVKGQLDYEDMRSHVLIVAMTDHGNPPKESNMYVIVNVADVNEWRPEFVQSSYQVFIQEDLPRGSDVVKVLAKDKDQGQDAILKYSITSGNYGYAFSIQPQSGVIQTNRILKASHISDYVLTVEARDDGSHGISAKTNVTVKLLSRRHRPGFAKDVFSTSVLENQPINTFVESVHLIGWMTFYTIVGKTCVDGFQINQFTGVITTKQMFDAERISNCSLRVKAQDGDGYSQETTVHVEIKDLNDNRPLMEKELFSGYIEENAKEDTPVFNAYGKVLAIAAHDMDIDWKNNQLKYEIISPGMDDYFKINENTGALLTSKLYLDYEKQQSYKVVVKVSDSGLPSLSDIATVVVHVKNINDVAPEFSKSVFEVSMYLPTYKGVYVTTLTASDQDHLGNITFSISQQDTSSLLTLDASRGTVFIGDPSKAKQGWYNAVVNVDDGKWKGSAKLRVTFKPIPVSSLRFPRAFFRVHVRENTSLVQTVFTPFVRGYKIRDRVRFKLGNFHDIFTIKESTGVVRTKPEVVLDREKISSYHLVVMVQDDDSTSPRMAQSVVIVIVDDVNDCKPTFPSPPIFFVVPKSSKSGSTVATITASDCDDGKNGEIRYKIKDNSAMFDIDSRTGTLKVLGDQLIGLTTPTEITLIIEAEDLGDKPLKSKAEVSVRIESGDACIFEKPSYTVEVAEDASVDKVFKQLHARCPKGKPVFNIMSGDDLSQFTIDLNSGELSLSSKLDFETTPDYQLAVRAKDSNTGASSQATVNIVVKDVNDNPPLFKNSPYFTRIRENSPEGTKLLSIGSTDLDSEENQRRSYEITEDTALFPGTFSINAVTGVLQVNKRLDYEKDKRFGVTVRVTDHGQPSLSSETVVSIFVMDVNDNAPRFEKSHYSATVLENAGPDHFVTKVLATDADETDFLKLKYKIASGSGKRYFRIDSNGVVSLSEVPGLALGKVYKFKLSVNDGNFTAYTRLVVVVGQANNHPPKFQTDLFFAKVTENYPADTYVAMVTATDRDSGIFGELVYAIDSGKAAKDFKVDEVSGIITTRKPLDREVMNAITIPIRARDKGGESTFCTVQVSILDENDNQPQFLMPSYTAVVDVKRASVGESVIRVRAVDPDTGDNSVLTYSIVGQISPFVFGINSTSGVIKFLRKPRKSIYYFYVRVNDNGYLKLKSYAQVRVSIKSLLFQFKHKKYTLSLSEIVQGRVPLKLELIDNNGAQVTSNVDYSIEVGTSLSTNKLGTFSFNSLGELQVSKSLDYETVQRYDLVVRANRSSFSTYATVYIKVLDENDNEPEFESDLYVVNVLEGSPKGIKIVQVRAHDKDSKENGMITYEMSDEPKGILNVFAINRKTGWITTNGTKGYLDREVVPSYLLKINAKDHGRDNTFITTTHVKINLDDINDSPPVFSNRIYVQSIREDLPIGSEVLTLNTTDKDAKSRIIYYIVSGDRHNRFNIDQTSGKIYVNAKLDREFFPRYLLNITASDGAFTGFALVEIEITDVNDNKPICHRSYLRVQVFENITAETPIATLNATDSDANNNSKITFTTSSNKFNVGSSTGVLTVDHQLDREKKSSYNFLVKASDGNDDCHTNVTVGLLDINDSPPKFTKAHYIKVVAMNAEENAVLLRVEATDEDIGLNRKVSYAFTNASTALVFSIEKETGVISLKDRLLGRDEEKFLFGVIATDSGVPPLSSEAIVEIVVSTITNCSFVKDNYKSEIREDTQPTYEIETLSVACGGYQFTIIYKIAGENDDAHKLFTINEKTGQLSLKALLDYETSRVHIFTVEALMLKPSGKTILISSASVKIKVVDCNDNKPVFQKISYKGTIGENCEIGATVISLTADDSDLSNVVHYTIIKSLPDASKFSVDRKNGVVKVKGNLDREKIEKYELVIRAEDDGSPPLYSDVSLVILVEDRNDNPPVVKKEVKALLRTDSPIGTVILQLKPTDADGPLNSEPFKFSVLSGENGLFKLNASSGALTVARHLSRHNTTYSMILRTTDNGSPAMFAETSVVITLVKYSLNPPKVQPVTVYVNMFAKKFNGGIIGKIVAHDPDKDDILQYSLIKGNNSQFSIGSKDGTIKMISVLQPRSYSLEVEVTDGTHKVNTQVSVRVREITTDVVKNSVTIRITDKMLSSFVSSSLSPMIDTLADIKSCAVSHVCLWSIQTAPDNKLDVVFAIEKPEGKVFFDPSHLRETLEDQLKKFQRLSKVEVFSVGIFPCDERHCPTGKECRSKISMLNQWSILTSDTTTFLSYKNEHTTECVCPEGVSDSDCVHVPLSECLNNPCKSGRKCVDIDGSTGYKCVCPAGKICQDDCRGEKCHSDAMTFGGNSYVRYSLTNENSKMSSFSVSVRTTKPFGTIFSAKGAYDYFILEIVEGKIRVRFNYGSGEGVGSIGQVKVNDGQWYDVKVTRKERNVRLTLNGGKYMAEAVSLGSMRFLNVFMNDIIVGGELPKRSKRNARTVSNGFFGCMESPRLNGNDLPLSGDNAMAKSASQGVTTNCSINVCHPSFCHNGGQCNIVEQNGYEVPSCICQAGFTGNYCSKDVDECKSSPCKNSGECKNTNGSFQCICVDKNFEGRECEIAVAAISQTEPFGTREFIYIGATIFILIIVAIIIVCACRCCHKRKRKSKARGVLQERHEMKMKYKDTDDEMSPHPPPPPPRRGDVEDPPTRLNSRAPSWDYADLPEMGPDRRKLSGSDSFLNLPTKNYDDLGECSGTNGIPQVPKRPRHISETQSVPNVPKKPTQYRCSRASSQSSVRSQSYPDVSEFGDEGLEIIRRGTKDMEKLFSKAADVVDDLLGTKCKSTSSDCGNRSECSEVENEIFSAGHLETYDDNEVDYFIPEADLDTTSVNNSDNETSVMLEKIPNVRHSRGEVLPKESQL